MIQTIRDHPAVFAGLVALTPAVLCWLSGRRLAGQLDDSTLPERLLVHQRRNGIAVGLALVAIGMLSPAALLWAGPLTFSVLLLAGYSLRRMLFGETWSAARYLSFFHRLILAIFGFWIVLAALPFLAPLAGRLDWLAGAVLAGGLIVWDHHYAAVVRRCLRARPLEEGRLLQRCRMLADSCGMPQPAFMRVDLGGGVIANALALPSLRGNAVLFTDTLLERLTEEESAAICAHELAHFEHFTLARLKQLRVVTLALVAAGALVAPVARVSGLGESWLPGAVWLGALTLALVSRAKDKQRQETICDQRAVALVGGAEPLVSALTTLYTCARIPRRLERRQEQSGSHPSLSRRIRDIRKAAGTGAAALEQAITVTGSDGQTSVTFERDALRWVEQAGVTQVLTYAHLVELRLDPQGRRGPRLRAASDSARRWDMAIAPSDVARVQDALDRIDGQLADAPAPRGVGVNLGRRFVMFAAVLALSLGQVAVSIAALLAWFVPAAPLLSAAGVAALAAAALRLRDGLPGAALGLPVLLAAAGIVLVRLAWAARQEPKRNSVPHLAILAAIAVASAAWLGANGLNPIDLHMSARSTPAAVVLWLALAAGLACSPRPRSKVAGLTAAGVGMAVAAVGSQPFLDRVGRDPFLVESQAVRWTLVETALSQDFELPPLTSRIQLSPGGLRIAALQQSESGDEAPVFQVGAPGGSLSPLSGDDLRFLDDETVLIVKSDEAGTTLRQVHVEPPHAELWRQRVPQVRSSSLSIARATGGWRLNGFDAVEAIVRTEGTIGTDQRRERRWPVHHGRNAWIDAVTTDGGAPLVVETSYGHGLFEHLPAGGQALSLMFRPVTRQSRYWSIDAEGTKPLGSSRLGADCASGLADGSLLCSVYDGTRTRLVRLAADTGAVTGMGWLAGRFVGDGDVVDGWWTGWSSSAAVALDVLNGRALTLPRSEGAIGHLAVSGGRLAAVVLNQGGWRLRIYEIGAPDGARAQRTALTSSRSPRPAPRPPPASSAPHSARAGNPHR